MEKISDETVQQVKQYSGIVDVINHYVPLKRRGRNYIGLCPFHSERTPSFTVSPDKRIFHCFGCHESGDLISFIQKIDSASFIDAIETIALHANIPIIKEEYQSADPQFGLSRKQLLELLDSVKTLYQEKLHEPVNKSVKEYLLNRGISEDSITDFSLGFSPKQLALMSFLEKKEFSSDSIKESGLFSFGSNQTYERFSGRLMFPIHDYQNRVVGFGGRILEKNDKMAKYVNSEETKFFTKRKILYGLAKAKQHITKKGLILLMEGYIDVIMAHQYGFKHAVACMGTSLTEEQVKAMKRFTDKIYLVMDSDTAGQRSALRSYSLLKQFDCSVYVVQLDQKDPADLLTSEGGDALEQKINDAKPGFLFYFENLLSTQNSETIEEKAAIIDEALETLKNEKDPLIQHHYIEAMAARLSLDVNLIMAKFRRTNYNNVGFSNVNKSQQKTKYEKAEELIIAMISSDVKLRELAKNSLNGDEFVSADWKKIYDLIQQTDVINQEILYILDEANLKDKYAKCLVENEEFVKTKQLDKALIDYINVLKGFHQEKKRDEIKEKIKQLEATGSEDEIMSLLAELKKGG